MKKRYLNVSYEDRHLAKRLGALWDPSVRRWYCVEDSALSKIFEWRKEAKTNTIELERQEIKDVEPRQRVQTSVVRKPNTRNNSFTEQKLAKGTKSQNLELFA